MIFACRTRIPTSVAYTHNTELIFWGYMHDLFDLMHQLQKATKSGLSQVTVFSLAILYTQVSRAYMYICKPA
jgi:hypothetical protein